MLVLLDKQLSKGGHKHKHERKVPACREPVSWSHACIFLGTTRIYLSQDSWRDVPS